MNHAITYAYMPQLNRTSFYVSRPSISCVQFHLNAIKKKKIFKWIKNVEIKKLSTIGLAFKNDYGLLSCSVCLIAAEFNQTSTCWCFISSRCMVCVGDIMSATIATVWQCWCRQHKSTFFLWWSLISRNHKQLHLTHNPIAILFDYTIPLSIWFTAMNSLTV